MKDTVLIRIYHQREWDPEKEEKAILDTRRRYESLMGGCVWEGGWKVFRTAKGKPMFSGESDRFLSISHSDAFWACAISDQNVGLDIQKHQSGRYEAISRKWFHRNERDYLEQWGYDHFFDVWTAKESYVKYTGTGMDEHFGSFYTAGREGLEKKVRDETGGAVLTSVPFQTGYSMCLCTVNEPQVYTYMS